MDPNIETLRNNFSASTTSLRCSTRIHPPQLPTSTFSLVFELFEEGTPRGIVYLFCEPSTSKPENVELFDADYVEPANEIERNFVMVVVSATCFLGFRSSNKPHSLSPPIRSFHAAALPPLCISYMTCSNFATTRIRNHLAIWKRHKVLDTNINASCFDSRW